MVIDIELTLNRFGFGKISDNKFQFLFFRLSKWKIPNKHSISFEINWKKKENFEVKQNINNKQFILLLDGMMGSGKTTTSKFLSEFNPRENMGFINIDTTNLKENEPSDIIIKELGNIKVS